jgi:hypothetical protein
MTTFFQHVDDGVRFAYVYHVAGLDWAATNDADFAAWINGESTEAADYRKLLFGTRAQDLIQVVTALDPNLGPQTITSTREGGIDVGAWTVSVNGNASGYKFGKLFPYTPYTYWQQGMIGLDWSPVADPSRVKFGIMSRDLRVSRDSGVSIGTGTLYWSQGNDYGLKDFIEANNGADDSPVYLWVGSSCLATNSAVVESGDDWAVDIVSGQFAAPLEDLTYSPNLRYQITVVPLEMAGLTARLFAVPIDVTETTSFPIGYGVAYGIGYI